jgi:hypothetical protein
VKFFFAKGYLHVLYEIVRAENPEKLQPLETLTDEVGRTLGIRIALFLDARVIYLDQSWMQQQ